MNKQQARTFKILAHWFLILTICSAYKVSDFKPSILKPSPPSGYHNVDTGLQTQGKVLCFGDINGDQYTDYVGYSSRRPLQLIIYFWNDKQSQFLNDTLSLQTYKDDVATVEQVMLADLDADGVHQIIITYIPTSTPGNIKNYSTIAYRVLGCRDRSCDYKQYAMNNSGLAKMTSVPTLLDLGNSMVGFLVFQGNQRYVVERKGNSYVKNNFSEFLNDRNKPESYKKVNNHFASNVDFDGDCHSDLVLLSINGAGKSVLQFYQKQVNSKYQYHNELIFNDTVKFVTFVDYDASGTTDIVLIMGDNTVANMSEQIYVLPNQYQPIDICQKFEDFPYRIENIKKIPFPFAISTNSILHFGDVNSDSYPDLLTIVTSNDFRKAILFKNIPDQKGNRVLQQANDLNSNLISQQKNPNQVAFFDLGQDGKIDIFIMTQQQTDSDRSTVITRTCFVNNVKDDTLFIKILPLSQTSTYQTSSQKLAGSFGVTMQWRITKLDGYKKISILNQKTQWNYGTLQLPFASGGLGRTNNYVEDLTVGYLTVGKKMSWSPIIPDSKLLVYQKKGEWKLETLLTNNERVNQVVYVSVVILFVLGIIIFFLNYRENQEDKRDQYNFIQLIR